LHFGAERVRLARGGNLNENANLNGNTNRSHSRPHSAAVRAGSAAPLEFLPRPNV